MRVTDNATAAIAPIRLLVTERDGCQLMTGALQLDLERSRPNDGLPPPTEEGSAMDRDLSTESGVASIWHEVRL